MRLDRLLYITILLINRRKVTAPDLAEHFGVSTGIIYRNIEAVLNDGQLPQMFIQHDPARARMISDTRASLLIQTTKSLL